MAIASCQNDSSAIIYSNCSTYLLGNSTDDILTNGTSPARSALWYAHMYVTPILIVIGLIGNIISFLVFVGTHLRQLSSTMYLAALALADSGFLVQLFASWLGYVRIFWFHKEGWCQSFVYLSYVCSFLSVWLVVGFTAERYIAVCYPLKRQDMCTVKRAKIVVVTLTIFALVAYSFGAWTSGLVPQGNNKMGCSCLPRFCPFVRIMANIDTVVTLIIPLFAIFMMNVRIIYQISTFYKDKRLTFVMRHPSKATNTAIASITPGTACKNVQDIEENSPSGSPQCKQKAESCHLMNRSQRSTIRGAPSESVNTTKDELIHRNSSTLRNRSQIKITKMLLIVSSIFLILNLPSHAVRIYLFAVQLLAPHAHVPYDLLRVQQVFYLLYYANFSVNFFLYSLCGKNFRKALWRLGAKMRGQVQSLAQSKYRIGSPVLGRGQDRCEGAQATPSHQVIRTSYSWADPPQSNSDTDSNTCRQRGSHEHELCDINPKNADLVFYES